MTFGFSLIETASPPPIQETVTISTVKVGGDTPYLVLDAAPSATSDTRQQVYRVLRRQEENGKNDGGGFGTMGPKGSSKPLSQERDS